MTENIRTDTCPWSLIIAAESLGARSLCCVVTMADQCIVIDPGIALGYKRHGLLPHPVQIAVGYQLRQQILQALANATDVVFSHFHGDHVPLANANPYQLSINSLPLGFHQLRCWCKSSKDLSQTMRQRFQDLAGLLGENLQIAESLTKAQALNDLNRIYALAKAQGIDFNWVALPEKYQPAESDEFDKKEMNRLFKQGFEEGLKKNVWKKIPPGIYY